MKKIITLFALCIIGCAKIFAFGIGGGYSLDSGLNAELYFSDSEKGGFGVGVGFDPGTKGGIAFTVFVDGYYDFILVDKGSFLFGPEIAVNGGAGFGIGDGAFGMLAFASPAVGVKFGLASGKFDIFARYQPYFIFNGFAVAHDDGQTAMVQDIQGFNFLGFALGVRYHF